MESSTVGLRPAVPGDLAWVVARHGAVYREEFGWDERFEELVGRIVDAYARQRDPETEAAWIAELEGRRAGCVFCMDRGDGVAQLRLLLVEPWARGSGIGTALVDRCIAFARSAGYDQIMLWTNHVLDDARRIYERAGFEMRREEPHSSFGHELVGQDWWLAL